MPHLSKEEIQAAARKYFPLAVSMAQKQQQRLPAGRNELKDLIGVASVGLVECLHRYDPSRGTQLSLWVYCHVKDAILDYLRSLDPLPQKVRAMVKLVEQGVEILEARLFRKPATAEIVEMLEWTARVVLETCQKERVETDTYKAAVDLVRTLNHQARTEHKKQDTKNPVQKAEEVLEAKLGRKPTYSELVNQLGWGADEIHKLMQVGNSGTLPPAEPAGYGGPETVTGWEDCWEGLTEDEKVVVQMHASGATLEEIENIVGTPVSTLGRKLDSARRKLTECL